MNSTSFGHYICFVRTADGRWYCCDDARVAPTSVTRVLAQNAYMLFYQRDIPKQAPQPGYKRPTPLTPAAIQSAAAATLVSPAAGVQQHPAVPVFADGTAEVVQQQKQEEPESEQQQQQAPLQTEHLARVSTAPAALVHMVEDLGSSSNRDEEDPSPRSSLNGQTPACSTHRGPADAAANGTLHPRSLSSSSIGSSSSSLAGNPLVDQPANGLPQAETSTSSVLPANHLQQQAAGADDLPVNSTTGSGDLPPPQYQLSRSGPELLLLTIMLPGVTSTLGISVDVLNAQPQRLHLKVPGKFAALDIPLAQELASKQQLVETVSGKFDRRRQTLRLHLHLVSSCQQQQTQDNVDQPQEATCLVPYAVHWHSTDGGDTSDSESSSESFMMPQSSFRSVMSEVDLSSYLGRHSSQGLKQDLVSQHLEQQDGLVNGQRTAAGAHTADRGDHKPNKPKAAGRKSGSKKSSKGKKRR